MNEVPVRLLRETLQVRGPAGSGPDCLDAETVAAWADDTLGRDERRAAETHAAGCARCLALVAAMAQTAPPAAQRSWWRAPAVGWLVPLTAAAAALLVWMMVPGPARGPAVTSMSSAIVPEQPRPSVAEVASAPLRSSKADAQAVNRNERAAAGRERAPAAAAGQIGAAPPVGMAKALAENARVGAAPSSSLAPSSAQSATAAAAPPLPSAAADAAAGGVIEPPVSVQRTAAAPLGSAGARNLLLEARRPPAVIASPNPISLWRILDGGVVEHSADEGATWEQQPTGVTVMLTAGASPAPSVCWLVGPQGIVLLSIDGRSWQRITFPETADLTSVRATDASTATVYTADGRAFSTSDGGRSWTP
ncbi:MAG: hypothetical protein ABI868_16635 [Acidobacteriota bacterium]